MLRTEKIGTLSRTIHKHKVRSRTWDANNPKNAFNRFLPIALNKFPLIDEFISKFSFDGTSCIPEEMSNTVFNEMSRSKLTALRKELNEFNTTHFDIKPYSDCHARLIIKTFSGFPGYMMTDIFRGYDLAGILRKNNFELKPHEAVIGHLLYRNYRREQKIRAKLYNLCKYLRREVSSRIDRR
ncbi:hypothetical protein F0M16_17875 [Vibrio cholerae]|uniref:Uncharacterized protein n=1 Tax=Vibrio cholerae TaxID=666 RepID=A0A5Q6PEV1_VIBCL|nr:hypothetical protein [Vibrio cholerae]KAA1253402.1 hypothetical protein F0M16_17875 [Vibrio cholerae]